ncbi:hydroxyethylthiazole kinase [Paenibacillus sp. WLX1005]|uniref:hydroxyethylthiazole kinase n=1 Tax=Paenibacillus sp. WLX1005 TaxID=3243766 RepID=UPI0039842F43
MSFLRTVRERQPLVHNITNVVVTNFTANGLLALGASPFMAFAHEEVEDVAAMAGAVMLNIGTLDPYVVQSILLAGKAANHASVPVVFDPVGAGATPYRTASAQQITEEVRVDIVRGNVAEVANVIGEAWQIKGVDAGGGDGDRVQLAIRAARQLHCIVVITGAEDLVTDGEQVHGIANGHPLLTQVTGAGCLLSSVVAAFAAVTDGSRAQLLQSSVEALIFYGVAAELAAERAGQHGTGSFQIELLNMLGTVTPEQVQQRGRMTQKLDIHQPDHHLS